jgi:hypothetical protein
MHIITSIEPRKGALTAKRAYSFAFSVMVGIKMSLISLAASFKKNAIRSQPRFLLTMLNWTLFSLIMYAMLEMELALIQCDISHSKELTPNLHR